jgi:hypothetical protein
LVPPRLKPGVSQTIDMHDDQVTFDEWWSDFHGNKWDSGNVAVHALLSFASQLSPAKRDAFVEGLVNVGWLRDGSLIALGALEELATPAVRRQIAGVVETLPKVHPPHALGDYRSTLLRVLAKDPSGEFLEPVDDYCQADIGLGYSAVVWALWPHHVERFAKYHARYFAEQPWLEWSQSCEVVVFVDKPEALLAVRDALLEVKPDEWNDLSKAVLTACTPAPSWCREDEVRKVRRICEQAG